ncbi:hypothetical protein BLNAU_2693 [Blattamonas nauphoetae]|uniref:Uncharacterized protein n=1 Tax=Blattamonas nauphoetae TaxID=2049346 RepID=A0ABQ9YFL3_9EUKA|nr:hypothetical protein BLNAU_2693 [Blattamonas nauphoetae]
MRMIFTEEDTFSAQVKQTLGTKIDRRPMSVWFIQFSYRYLQISVRSCGWNLRFDDCVRTEGCVFCAHAYLSNGSETWGGRCVVGSFWGLSPKSNNVCPLKDLYSQQLPISSFHQIVIVVSILIGFMGVLCLLCLFGSFLKIRLIRRQRKYQPMMMTVVDRIGLFPRQDSLQSVENAN